ncbi:DUF349 domain-containing protein [Phytohalomonas tamaricis]|uniref:DUF349 domain-containing protein n=1 Tax=Phytohalomonas tamaricis TaxID=2081032 RepID=UPI000D0B9151|nr:DUF349 domain-containing protein [Phytohalomonas tamaricis]
MPGFLQRFFAPRWRHPDAHVRREAVGRLDPQRDRDTLLVLLDDNDEHVRRTALERLDDPNQLVERSPFEKAELNALLVRHVTGEHESSLPLEERQMLLEKIAAPALLNDIALRADNQQLRLSALARLDDEAVLVDQACRNSIAAVRHAAAARVESDEGLERLARESRRDRNIARQARNRINQRRAATRDLETRQARREELLESLERHGAHSWEPLYDARYRHLVREWELNASGADAEQERRFHLADQRCRVTIHEHEAHHRAAEAEALAQAQAQTKRQEIIDALESTLAHLQQPPAPSRQDIDSMVAQRRLQSERWRVLSDERSPQVQVQERYEQLLSELDAIGSAWQRLEDHKAALEQALDAGDKAPLDVLAREIDWPTALPRPQLLDELYRACQSNAAERAADVVASRAQEERFAADLERLEALLESGELRAATRLLDTIKQRDTHLDPKARERFSATVKRLTAQTAELRDWRGFVAAPKREQLCTAMEALIDEPLTDMERDRRHRQLVSEWKALGDAAATRQLSSRFREASDKVKASLRHYFEERIHQRNENLAHREALCAQLEALLAAPDAGADPDALRQIRNRSREEWQRYTPVPREQAEAVRQRFAQSMRGLQALIDDRARALADAKRDLIEQVQALADETGDAEARAEQAKALQQQWRALGRAPKGEEQALWKTFRHACDTVFAARDHQRNKRKAQQDERFDAMQALIDRLDAWQPASIEERHILDEAEAEVIRLAPLPAGRRTEGMQRRWNGIIRARHQTLEQLARDVLISRWHAWRPLLDAHVDADTRALAGEAVADIETEIALDKDALKAHQQRNRMRRTSTKEAGADRLSHLRVHLAVLADAPIAPEDEPRRLDVQVARLNDSMGTTLTRQQELEQVQLHVLATGPISADTWRIEAPLLDEFMEIMRGRQWE